MKIIKKLQVIAFYAGGRLQMLKRISTYTLISILEGRYI